MVGDLLNRLGGCRQRQEFDHEHTAKRVLIGNAKQCGTGKWGLALEPGDRKRGIVIFSRTQKKTCVHVFLTQNIILVRKMLTQDFFSRPARRGVAWRRGGLKKTLFMTTLILTPEYYFALKENYFVLLIFRFH